MQLSPGAVAAVHRLHRLPRCVSSRGSPLSACARRPRSCWVEDCGDGGGVLRHCGLGAGESEESCGLSESDVFSLGLTGLPGAVAAAAAQQQHWSAFALGAQTEAWPAGGQVRLGAKAEEPSLLEEALTSCGLASLYPQLSERSASASAAATGAPCGLAGACGSLGPFGGLAVDAPGHLSTQVDFALLAFLAAGGPVEPELECCHRGCCLAASSGEAAVCLAGSRHGGSVRLLVA
jgi:hypothetical protein